MFDFVLIFLDNEDYNAGGDETEGDTEDGGGEEGLDGGSRLGLLAGQRQRVTADVQFERVCGRLSHNCLEFNRNTWFIRLLNTAPASGEIVLYKFMYFTMKLVVSTIRK